MSNRPNPSKPRKVPQSSVAAARGSEGPSRLVWIIGGAVVVVAAALLAAVLARSPSTSDAIPTGADARAVVQKATTVPATVFDDVGVGSADGSIKAISGDPLEKDGKPEVLYVGAEYCPFCAAERWAVVTALSRFGTFSDLGLTRSSTSDSYPGTASFSFHGSRYQSRYVSFTGLETETNERNEQGGYKSLDTLTAAQEGVLRANSDGSIPFMDIGGRYVSSGATFSPEVLQGESFADIAAGLRDPESDVAQGAVGSANVLTALICNVTNGQPGAVCNSAAVKAAASKVPAG